MTPSGESVGTPQQQVKWAREHASLQVRHLLRQIDYGYPATVLRNDRALADRAVIDLCKALDQQGRAERAAARRKAAAR